MSQIAICIENLSKEYCLKQVGTGTLAHDLNRWWHQVRGKEDPYLRVGETNVRTTQGSSEYVYALKDVNLEVKQGEVLGIIGKNGAGKSTLLKILSKITGPTAGKIKIRGRMASLLEVGTGFHGELTGRENIYMNGTIMGMTRREIASKLDQIVEFAGVRRYLDTPVKRYSSGMMVRLGFAIAAHLEPELLVVDEVLAVGDAEFQKKAIGKMKEVSEGHGRTVLFVSHNMTSIKALCSRVAVIHDGELSFLGDVAEGIHRYLSLNEAQTQTRLADRNDRVQTGSPDLKLLDYRFTDLDGRAIQHVNFGQGFKVLLDYEAHENLTDLLVILVVHKLEGTVMFVCSNSYFETKIDNHRARARITFTIEELNLHPGDYHIDFHIGGREGNTIDGIVNAALLRVEASDSYPFTSYDLLKQGFFVRHSVEQEVIVRGAPDHGPTSSSGD